MNDILCLLGFIISFLVVSFFLRVVVNKFITYKKRKEIQLKNMVHKREVEGTFDVLYSGLSFSECYYILESIHFMGLPIDKGKNGNIRVYEWSTNDEDLEKYTFSLIFMNSQLVSKELKCNRYVKSMNF